MANTASHAEQIATPQTKSVGRIVTALVRILLGLMFLVFGLDGFLHFMPMPKDLPQDVIMVSSGLMKGGHLPVVAGRKY